MTLWASVILAAGKGTRMRSKLPKVLHTIGDREMLLHVLDSTSETRPHISAVVVGPDSSSIEQVVGNGTKLIIPKEQLGTGHALLQSKSQLEGQVDHVLVVNGDVPLITGPTLQRNDAASCLHGSCDDLSDLPALRVTWLGQGCQRLGRAGD